MDGAGANKSLDKQVAQASGEQGAMASIFGDMLERNSILFDAGLRYWRLETVRAIDETVTQGRMIFERLQSAKTPLDVLSAEQDWLRARNRSLLESGLRFAAAVATALDRPKATAPNS